MRGRTATGIVCLFVAAISAWAAAAQLYKDARKAEEAGEYSRAYLLYAQAAAQDPGNAEYWSRSQALRARALISTEPAVIDAPAEPPETISEKELAEAREPLPPKELNAQPGRRAIDLRGDARALFEQTARLYGLDVVFDGEYQPGQPFRFRLDDADYRLALQALEAATSSFVVPLSDKLIMVFKDTAQKRLESEPTVAVVVPIPHPVTVQEAQELARTVQQTMEIQRFGVDNGRRLALLKDRISKVRPAQQLFEQLLRHKAEVVIEVEFLDVSANSSLEYGLRLPTSFALVNFGSIWNSKVSIPAGFTKFLTFGAGKTFIGLGITDAQLFASMSQSSATSLLKADLRATDGQASTLHIGDRYPILTSGYFGDTGGTDGEVFRPPPSYSFEDLGLSLKITPRVHSTDEVTLEVESEFKVLSGSSVNDIPVISNRKFQSKIRLATGKWAILAGLVSRQEARTISGIAGLASLPVLGPLLRSTTSNKDNGEALLLLKPRVLSLPPSEIPTRQLWVGSEGRPLIGL